MCMSFYISTPKEVQTSKYVDDETYFYCEKENEVEPLKNKFSHDNIYYCGSYTCCGCGFYFDFDDEEDEDDVNQNKWGKKSFEEMFDFFKTNISELKEIEMFVCWEGDEKLEPKVFKTIELSKFKFGRSLIFDQLDFIKIIP